MKDFHITLLEKSIDIDIPKTKILEHISLSSKTKESRERTETGKCNKNIS